MTEQLSMTSHVARELAGIGLTMIEDPDAHGFMPDVLIDQGCLRHKPDALPANLLHEAGHVAIVPASLREHVSGNLKGLYRAIEAVFKSRGFDNPDDPFLRACIQCSDPEATAWAFAFGTHIGLSPKTIIHDEQYGGDGESIRVGLQLQAYIGINGLRAAGFLPTVRAYPKLKFWLQPA